MKLEESLGQFGSLSLGWQIAIPLLCLLFVALFAIVFWMGGALASVDRVTFLGSLLYGSVQFFLLLGATIGVFSALAGTGDVRTWLQGRNLLLGGGAALLIDLVLIVFLVLLVVKGTVGEALLIWLLRLPLLALLAALTAGLVFVGLAVEQTANEPNGGQFLVFVGLGLLGVTVLGIVIFFATRFSGPTVVRRPGS